MAEETKVVRVWPEAHDSIEKLAELLAKEKGLRSVSYTEAVSLAIKEAVENHSNEPKKRGKATAA